MVQHLRCQCLYDSGTCLLLTAQWRIVKKTVPLRKRCRFFSVLKGQDNHVNESQMSLKISTNEDKSHSAEQPIAAAIPKWQ